MQSMGSAICDERPRTDAERWAAVEARDRQLDRAFVFAVRTTGVYCVPSCPARRPRRENVVFYDNPEAAAAAGFRPCRRCRPDAALAPVDDLVQQARAWIEAHATESVTLVALGQALGISPGHLQRVFTQRVGVSPRAYAEALRIGRVKALLREGETVTNALYQAGYGSSSRLYERAGTGLGMTPGAYRRKGQGIQITYSIVDSPLERLLVAATARGICALALANEDAPLEAFLEEEFPLAERRRDDQSSNTHLGPILAYLRGEQPRLDLPLDLSGTDFQRTVWDMLRQIPYGETRTYHDLASQLGRPSAARAVGRACATNPASLVVPCHRALRRDGGLAGYRWGLERKQALLDLERQGAAPRDTPPAPLTPPLPEPAENGHLR